MNFGVLGLLSDHELIFMSATQTVNFVLKSAKNKMKYTYAWIAGSGARLSRPEGSKEHGSIFVDLVLFRQLTGDKLPVEVFWK